MNIYTEGWINDAKEVDKTLQFLTGGEATVANPRAKLQELFNNSNRNSIPGLDDIPTDPIAADAFRELMLAKATAALALSKKYNMSDCVLKFDHFENIHRLKDDATLVTKDSPNFRKVNGFEVFGTGQPTLTAFPQGLDYIKGLGYNNVVWTNMRQEPVVYANGMSFTPRLANRMNENMEFPGITGPELEDLQADFVAVLQGRAQAEDNKVHYFKDTYAEHPADRKNIEHIVPLEGDAPLQTLSDVYDNLNKAGYELSYVRLPIQDEKAPNEKDFDMLVAALRVAPANAACVFNCQMGKGRTTTGMIIGCLVKHVLHQAGAEDIKAAVAAKEGKSEGPKDGLFAVINELIAAVPAAGPAKELLDTVIDWCGEAPRGTGLQNLRDCILWTKDKYDSEPPAKKNFWQHMSKNFIERYFYLICFATYVLEEAPKSQLESTFAAWMDAHANLRDMITAGMEAFQWE